MIERDSNYQCPYCGHHTTVGFGELGDSSLRLPRTPDGQSRISFESILCRNAKCGKFSLTAYHYRIYVLPDGQERVYDLLQAWRLIPASFAQVWPDYVPQQIRGDYVEACAIVDASPKAAASLARRCLQGMIRDFWGVTNKPTLRKEIEAIEEKVDPLTWQAIDAVRTIGNIGAHMENDVNLIIDVDPGEAEALIGLLELLERDWYVVREERQQRLRGIVQIAADKQAARDAGGAAQPGA